MHVFISWSGEPSKQLAQALRVFLEDTLQYVKPYFTPADIDKGAKWDSDISKHLEETDVCIIALARNALDSKWIMFEAGAISRKVEKARICPVLFGIEPTDVEGPLARFQATKFSKEEIFQLLTTINSKADDEALTQDVLGRAFKRSWPDFEGKIKEILAAPATSPAVRGERDLLVEAVELTRNISLQQGELRDAVNYITNTLLSVVRTADNAAMVRALSAPNLLAGGGGGGVARPGFAYGVSGPGGGYGGVAGPVGVTASGVTVEQPFSSIPPSESKKST